MKNLLALSFSILLLLYSGQILGQEPLTALIKTYYDKMLVNCDNLLLIVAQQKDPVTIDQVSASIQSYIFDENIRQLKISGNNGYFYINPDSIGLVTISVKTNSGITKQPFRTIEIPAVGFLSGYRARCEVKIHLNEMKAQQGLVPVVENYMFEIKCSIKSFETIRISNEMKVFKAKNIGGRFNEETLKIIEQTQSGDIYIFRNIRYRCPGATSQQRLEDMTFEIE